MNSTQLKRHVDEFLKDHPCAHPELARESLENLYEYVLERANDAEDTALKSKEWCARVCLVQQTICFTPLRLILPVLAQDEARFIRAAAKSEMADRTREYWNDPETGLMAMARLPISGKPINFNLVLRKITSDARVQKAIRLWHESLI